MAATIRCQKKIESAFRRSDDEALLPPSWIEFSPKLTVLIFPNRPMLAASSSLQLKTHHNPTIVTTAGLQIAIIPL